MEKAHYERPPGNWRSLFENTNNNYQKEAGGMMFSRKKLLICAGVMLVYSFGISKFIGPMYAGNSTMLALLFCGLAFAREKV